MKKFLLIVLAALTIVSCQKKDEPVALQQEVTFNAIQITPDGGLKSTDGSWDCQTEIINGVEILLVPTVAKVIITDGVTPVTYWLDVFLMDGKYYTQAVKLPTDDTPIIYTVTYFALFTAENGTMLMATPTDGSDYSEYVTDGVDFEFTVSKFAKTQVPVQVLCYWPDDYDNFGFDWFEVTQIVVREACFFGDICISNPADYATSIYVGGGIVNVDEEAAFRMIVKNGLGVEVPNSPFDNLGVYGTGSPLCVQYPDYLGVVDNFTFELQVWVPSSTPGVFTWQTYGIFTATDAGDIMFDPGTGSVSVGGNGTVVSFAVGDCSPMSAVIFDWDTAIAPTPLTFTVLPGDLAITDLGYYNNPSKWFYYDDGLDAAGHDRGIFAPNGNNNFFAGPGTPPLGTGSAQLFVPMWNLPPATNTNRQPQFALATRQFIGIPLANITEMKYSTYDPNTALPGVSINFNVSFDGVDGWQGRLTYTPPAYYQGAWHQYNPLTEGLWYKSGGQTWPVTGGTAGKTWNQVKSDYPNAKMRITDSWFGFRVDDNNSTDNTQNVDKLVFGVNGTSVTYDFEP